MAKKQYRYTGPSKWAGLSGNAILGLYNVPGSGKKISVHSVEIYNKNILGFQTGAADAFAPAPIRYHVVSPTTITGGETIVPRKMNSAAGDWPTDIEVKTNSVIEIPYINWNGSVTYTDATVAIGDVTFTPGSAPGWIAAEHRNAQRVFIGTSGNVGTYRIITNTTTDLTIEPPFTAAVSTTGYIAEIDSILFHGTLKTASPAISNVPVTSNGYINQTFSGTGSIFAKGNSSDNQDIIIRANEKIAIALDDIINTPLPVFVEATFVVEGTPNRTYTLSFYTFGISNNESILSVNNITGSGKVIRMTSLSVSEVGTLDTPYFQVVPIGSIDPVAFDDTDKHLTAYPINSNDGSLNSSIARLFTNVPVLPAGVPISYIAEGAPVAATPRGFNYLNTKDFIGPVYMTYFPEGAAFRIPNTTFYTAGAPGTIGTHISQEYSRIKGYSGSPIIIREGETLGIVSGAETATLTTAIGISGFGAYEFSITFTVEDAITPTVELTGLKVNSEVRAYVGSDPGTAIAIAGIENTGTSYSFTHDVAGQNGFVVIFHLDYDPITLVFSPYQAAAVTYPIQQQYDRQYLNP